MLNNVMLVLTLLVFILARSQLWAAPVDCSGFSTNGCSIPGNLPFFYKEVFTPACTRHDVCYHCGVHGTHQFSRWKCDNRFKKQMNKACRKLSSWWDRYFCHAAKQGYWWSVRQFGQEYYNRNVTGLEVCEDKWVKQCMRR